MENNKHITGFIREFDRAKAEETRTVEFVISDETRDRHGTIIPLKNWKLDRFNANGIVGYQHEVYGGMGASNPDQVLGVGEAFIEDGKLIGRVKFEPAEINPLAEKILQKIMHGSLKSTSVGFRELTRGKWGEKDEARDGATPTYYFGDVELLEFSIVNIPSNPNALRRELEADGQMKDADEEIKRLGAQIAAQADEIESLTTKIDLQSRLVETLEMTVKYYKNKSLRG